MKEEDFLNNLAPFPVWFEGRKIELCPIESRKIENKIISDFAKLKPKSGFKKVPILLSLSLKLQSIDTSINKIFSKLDFHK